MTTFRLRRPPPHRHLMRFLLWKVKGKRMLHAWKKSTKYLHPTPPHPHILSNSSASLSIVHPKAAKDSNLCPYGGSVWLLFPEQLLCKKPSLKRKQFQDFSFFLRVMVKTPWFLKYPVALIKSANV